MIATEEITKTTRYRRDQDFQNGGSPVYSAIDTASNLKVVIRELPAGLSKIMSLGQQDAFQSAFTEKARVLMSVKHESIQSTLDHYSEGDRHCLVLESIPGSDLAELLEKKKWAFPLHDVVNWADQMLDALHYLHTYLPPLYHHDLRPQNLKLTPGGKIKLLGVGFSQALEHGPVNSGIELNYRPLEQIWGGLDPASQKVITNSYDDRAERLLRQPPDSRSDVYGVGATLYHLLTGSAPVDALERSIDTLEGKSDPLRSPTELDAGVPPEISDVVMRALELRRENRYDSAVIMRQVLRTSLVRMKEREAVEALEQEKLNAEWAIAIAQEDTKKQRTPVEPPVKLHIEEKHEKQQAEEQARLHREAEEEANLLVEQMLLDHQATQEKLDIEEQMRLDLETENARQIEEQMNSDLEAERIRIEDEQKLILRKRLDEEAAKEREEEMRAADEHKKAGIEAERARQAEEERAARRAEVERLLAEEHAAEEALRSVVITNPANSDPFQPVAAPVGPETDDDLLEIPPMTAPGRDSGSDKDLFEVQQAKGGFSWWIPAAAVVLLIAGGGFFGMRSFLGSKTDDLNNQAAPAMSVSPAVKTDQPAENIPPVTEKAPETQPEAQTRDASTDTSTAQAPGKTKQAVQPQQQPQPAAKKPATEPAKTPAPKKAVTVDDLIRDN